MKLLKKLFVPLLLIIAVSFSSCKDDAEDLLKDLLPEEELLVGKWKLVAEVEDGKDVAVDDCDAKSTLVLTSSSIVSAGFDGENCDESYSAEGVYTVDGDKFNYTIETSSGDSETGVWTFEVSLTELRLTETDEEDTIIEVYEKETQL